MIIVNVSGTRPADGYVTADAITYQIKFCDGILRGRKTNRYSGKRKCSYGKSGQRKCSIRRDWNFLYICSCSEAERRVKHYS